MVVVPGPRGPVATLAPASEWHSPSTIESTALLIWSCFRRRVTGSRPSASAGQAPRNMGGSAGILRFYTDDAPGLKIGPTTVLVTSLLFIAFGVLLHISGKFRR